MSTLLHKTSDMLTFGYSRRSQFSIAILCWPMYCAAADPGDALVRAPTLQRVCVISEKSLFFDFDTSRGASTPTLVVIPSENANVTKYYLFGGLKGIHSVSLPFRWSIAESSLFCTQSVAGLPPWPAPPGLYRFPLSALVAGSDDGRWPIDDNRIPPTFGNITNENSLNLDFGTCGPIRDALHGFHRGWKEGVNRSGDPARAVHYDILAIDDTHIELFMTADGDLSRWVFDGKSWKNLKHYDLVLEGEFLVFDEGRSLIFERDDKWSTIRNINDAAPVVRDLTDRVENEPLILIEDSVGRTNHFIDRDRLLDEDGRELSKLRRGPDRDRIREAIQTVIARRRP